MVKPVPKVSPQDKNMLKSRLENGIMTQLYNGRLKQQFSGSVTKYVLRCPTRPPGDESTRFLSHFGFPVLELRRGMVHGTPPLGTG